MADMTTTEYQIGDTVRCPSAYGDVKTGTVSATPTPENPYYRVELGDLVDSEDGTVDHDCFLEAPAGHLELVRRPASRSNRTTDMIHLAPEDETSATVAR